MLTLENLNLRQDSFSLTANFSVESGARLAIMGASGAGKSTLLLAIAGFVLPRSGRVFWNDQDITKLAAAQRPAAILFQDQNLFPHLTLIENVVLGKTKGQRASAQQRQEAGAALSRVGLSGLEARKPAQVSGGQAARAALARMLLQGRPLWLLDEPFAALDEDLRREMLDLTGEVAGQIGATVMMITHQRQDAAQFAQSVVYVAEGVARAPISAADHLS
ncbi:MAG: ATP-binding cassette domain-containing protein [Cypionkella sp.]|nr:ATP-binding cassette domain-containing protein [Cypionkella sp.]